MCRVLFKIQVILHLNSAVQITSVYNPCLKLRSSHLVSKEVCPCQVLPQWLRRSMRARPHCAVSAEVRVLHAARKHHSRTTRRGDLGIPQLRVASYAPTCPHAQRHSYSPLWTIGAIETGPGVPGTPLDAREARYFIFGGLPGCPPLDQSIDRPPLARAGPTGYVTL